MLRCKGVIILVLTNSLKRRASFVTSVFASDEIYDICSHKKFNIRTTEVGSLTCMTLESTVVALNSYNHIVKDFPFENQHGGMRRYSW